MSETLIDEQTISLKQRIIANLKWLWIIIVLGGLTFYLVQNFANIGAQLQLVSPLSIFFALLLIAAGRICIIIMTREVLLSAGYPLSIGTIFYVVSTSDLAKYLPGGIWHFVGRAGYYKTLKLSVLEISQAILKENLWLIVSAGFSGSLLLIAGYRPQHLLWFAPVIALIWLAVIYLWGRHVSFPRIIGIIALQLFIWLFVGLSFSIILPLEATYSNVLIVSGAFTISWLIGFISLFAPGGIGVREIILVTILLPFLAGADSSVFAVTHRLLWIVIEFLFGLIAFIFFNMDSG